MVKSGKTYSTKGGDLKGIHDRLDGHSVFIDWEDGDFSTQLRHNIEELYEWNHGVSGEYVYDHVLINVHRGTVVYTVVTKEVPFRFIEKEGHIWLIIMVSKATANIIAVALGGICNLDVREASIYAKDMNQFLNVNDDAKVILFDEMDTPGVNKTTIYGEELVQTNLFKEFAERGTPKWIVTMVKKSGMTIGLGGDVGVVVYNNISLEEYLEFVEEEILPLASA